MMSVSVCCIVRSPCLESTIEKLAEIALHFHRSDDCSCFVREIVTDFVWFSLSMWKI
uniref:Uncharacterized protein n=1 Tax=Arundo donax TaxID=35708 RepID=A0A0A9E005_ARUDO